MKNTDSSLDRLLRSAGQCHPPVVEEAPYGFATRTAAAWLAGASPRELPGLETLWFRRSLFCALALMAASIGWSIRADTAAANDDMAIASYATTADLQ